MVHRPGLVTQAELSHWARTVGARSEFPRLVRRLILETVRGLVYLGIPAGEGVSSGDWDGTVRCTEGNPFVSAGLSVWELSVHQRPGTKAESDYQKRLTVPDGSPSADCTYIAASLQRWAQRADFARDHSRDGRWREVRAYGIDDIEAWLETAPVTWAWISEILGFHPYGLRSADSWWNTWARATTPALTPALVTAGRSEQVDAFRRRLDDEPQVTTVQAASVEEAQAFVAAVVVTAGSDPGNQLLARTAFVDEVATWRALMAQQTPLVLIPANHQLIGEVHGPSRHHVVVPMSASAPGDIELPRIDAGEAAAVLRASGLEEHRVDEAGRLARRSLTALRRQLSKKPELHEPVWASAPVSKSVRGILLAGKWSDANQADQRILAALTGAEYEQLKEDLLELTLPGDPLVALVDGFWGLVSPSDAWILLRSRIGDDDLQRFEAAVREVLTEWNPALDLPPEHRWKARLLSKEFTFSSDLRTGLATTLAFLGLHGEDVRGADGSTGTTWADYLVGILLVDANEDAASHRWASISDLLPILAEASPDLFLEAVEQGLTGRDPVLGTLFTDGHHDDSLTPSSPHTALLWALECLAWSGEHFGRAVDLLARLAEIDPGGRLVNRPAASLASIYCPWHPDCSATVFRRLAVLDGLRTRRPATAWQLMLSTLPQLRGLHSPTCGPRIRDRQTVYELPSVREYFDFVGQVVIRCIDDAGSAADKWAELLEKMPQLLPEDRKRVLDALQALVQSGNLTEDTAARLWDFLRDLADRHAEFADAEWSLPREEIERLREVASGLTPNSAYARNAWLFHDYMPHIGESRVSDHEAYESELRRLRRQAIQAINEEGGIELLIRLARQSAVPQAVGIAMAEVNGKAYENHILQLLESDDPHELELASSFFAYRFRAEGWVWLEEFIDRLTDSADITLARLLLATREFPRAWEIAEAKGDRVAECFWTELVPYGLGADFESVDLVAQRMMSFGRHAAALDFLVMYLGRRPGGEEELRATIVADGLERLLAAQDADPDVRLLSQYDLESLFRFLEAHAEAVGEDRIAGLEWAFLPSLGFEPNVPLLHSMMARDPAFFVGIVSTLYRPHSSSGQEEYSSDQERAAHNAYSLLQSWSRPPGMQPDGSTDLAVLRAWVEQAFEMLAAADRLEAGQLHIGQVLASSPVDADGSWPNQAVRDLLEEIRCRKVENGLRTAVMNSRGITSRGPEEGGRQERELAAKYREAAAAFRDRWPRSAVVLKSIASSYEREARWEEERAERIRQGFGW